MLVHESDFNQYLLLQWGGKLSFFELTSAASWPNAFHSFNIAALCSSLFGLLFNSSHKTDYVEHEKFAHGDWPNSNGGRFTVAI